MTDLIPKYLDEKLCYGLTNGEIRCQCSYESCRSSIVTKRLICAYESFRKMIGKPLFVNSGYRCIAHNYDVGGVALSRHTVGEALDISRKTLDHLSDEEIDHAARMCGFTFLKFYETFVHMDVRNSDL